MVARAPGKNAARPEVWLRCGKPSGEIRNARRMSPLGECASADSAAAWGAVMVQRSRKGRGRLPRPHDDFRAEKTHRVLHRPKVSRLFGTWRPPKVVGDINTGNGSYPIRSVRSRVKPPGWGRAASCCSVSRREIGRFGGQNNGGAGPENLRGVPAKSNAPA